MREMDKIYRLHAASIYRYLLSITSSPSLAEELTQETFFQATKSIHRYNGQCKIFVWLCQIAKHLYFDHLKKEKRFNRWIDWEQLDLETDGVFDLPEQALQAKDGVAALYREISDLPPNYREVVVLRLIADLSFGEIGELLGKTQNWARVTFFRAKTKLRERINDCE